MKTSPLKAPKITAYSIAVKPEEAWITVTDWRRSQEYWLSQTQALRDDLIAAKKEIAKLQDDCDKSIDGIMYEMGERES